MSLFSSLLLYQAVPAGLGRFPLSQPCRAAGKEPCAGGTGSSPGTMSQTSAAQVARPLHARGVLPTPLLGSTVAVGALLTSGFER